MIGRRQLPVASPISGPDLVRAFVDSLRANQNPSSAARIIVAQSFSASGVHLTDSGTSALVLALRIVAPKGATVAFPAYGCVDLVAAALFAGVRIRLYDIDPATLSPDLDSVRRTIERGVDAILVAHLFGYAADVAAVQEIATASGVPIIEDAAQGAGATLHDTRLGSFGALSVLSFGRGKGLCAGGGGALLAPDDQWRAIVANELGRPKPRRGWGALSKTAVQWALGRPSVYALPSAIPWLHLGEMVYHPANEPRGLSLASASLIPSAFALEPKDVALRRANAHSLDAAAEGVGGLIATTPLASSRPAYLRYAVRDVSNDRRVDPALGIVRPYPGVLADYPVTASAIAEGEPQMPGAAEIARSLFTLPTHRFVSRSDIAALGVWMRKND